MSRFLAILLGVIAMALATAVAQQPQGSPADTSGPDFRARVEKQTFLLVNQYRKQHDLPMLAWSDAVAHEARVHSQEMASGKVDFGHDGFRERVDHLKGELTHITGAGENVFMIDDPADVAQIAVTSWLHSPHHLKNIRGDYNFSGLGVWQNKDGIIYFTQLFVKNVAAPESAAAKPAPDPASVLWATPYTRNLR